MNLNLSTPALILILLFLWSAGYAAILDRIHDLYTPDHVWVTVVVGNLGVLGAYAILNTAGFAGWPWLLACNVAAGVPVVIWQAIQAQRRKVAALERKNHKNGANPTHEGRAGGPRSDS